MLEIFVIGIVACAAGLTGFVYGLRHRKVIEKEIKDSYTIYLEELVQNGTHKYDPHAAFNKAWDQSVKDISKEFVYREPPKNKS